MTIYALAGAALAFIAFVIWLYAKANRAGRAAEELNHALEAAAARERMGEAAVKAPRGKDEVVNRLRARGL